VLIRPSLLIDQEDAGRIGGIVGTTLGAL